jgi:CRISPR/Cas system-associated endoribonuclease Cas2
VQNSVFECLVDPALWVSLKTRLESEINPEQDSLRYQGDCTISHCPNRICSK